MKEGLPGGKLRLSPKSELEEALLHRSPERASAVAVCLLLLLGSKQQRCALASPNLSGPQREFSALPSLDVRRRVDGLRFRVR